MPEPLASAIAELLDLTGCDCRAHRDETPPEDLCIACKAEAEWRGLLELIVKLEHRNAVLEATVEALSGAGRGQA